MANDPSLYRLTCTEKISIFNIDWLINILYEMYIYVYNSWLKYLYYNYLKIKSMNEYIFFQIFNECYKESNGSLIKALNMLNQLVFSCAVVK